ncbi:unnamed protein product [Larinioides sclopetarius]|uniref:Uncharacterized protein n=1 Tax=Larinioides sclopetarius TaxID=280406 RepID=A0AAV2BR93_9ARAC
MAFHWPPVQKVAGPPLDDVMRMDATMKTGVSMDSFLTKSCCQTVRDRILHAWSNVRSSVALDVFLIQYWKMFRLEDFWTGPGQVFDHAYLSGL